MFRGGTDVSRRQRISPTVGEREAPAGVMRVVISEASPMGLELLSNALRRHRSFEVVGGAASGAALLRKVAEAKPDVVLLSSSLEEGPLAGFTVLRQIREVAPDTKPVMLLDGPDRELVISAFRGGAKGIFQRSSSLNGLSRCLTAVQQGQVWARSNELQWLLEALVAAVPLRVVNARGENLLTAREQQVVELLAQGMTNREIAQQLQLSEHTVKNYLFRIFEKLGISSRVELILYAVSRPAQAA